MNYQALCRILAADNSFDWQMVRASDGSRLDGFRYVIRGKPRTSTGRNIYCPILSACLIVLGEEKRPRKLTLPKAREILGLEFLSFKLAVHLADDTRQQRSRKPALYALLFASTVGRGMAGNYPGAYELFFPAGRLPDNLTQQAVKNWLRESKRTNPGPGRKENA